MNEKTIKIEINEWNSTETHLAIPELNFYKAFRYRVEALEWARAIFKNPEFVNITYP